MNVLIRRMAFSLILFVALLAGTVTLLDRLPTGFLPQEDQGRIFSSIQLPPGATADRTRKVLDTVIEHFRTQEADYVTGVFGIVGFNSQARARMLRSRSSSSRIWRRA